MFEELFYNRLIQLRNQKGVSARDMSLSIGQSPGYINGIENRNNLPSMTAFFYICDYFNISPKEFFDDGIKNPEKFNELIRDLKSLDGEQLAGVVAIVKSMRK